MFYGVIHRPNIDTHKINEIRAKYDPTLKLIDSHVTLVFPCSADDVSINDLEAHVQKVAHSTTSFEVRLNETELSWDQWLFLTPTIGRDNFITIHDELYKGVLESFLRKDIAFVPHIGLGHFAVAHGEYNLKDPTASILDEVKYRAAQAEVEKNRLDFSYVATLMELISINDEFTETKTIRIFNFN